MLLKCLIVSLLVVTMEIDIALCDRDVVSFESAFSITYYHLRSCICSLRSRNQYLFWQTRGRNLMFSVNYPEPIMQLKSSLYLFKRCVGKRPRYDMRTESTVQEKNKNNFLPKVLNIAILSK